MEENRVPKKLLIEKSDVRRRTRIPKSKWDDKMEDDLKKSGIRGWKMLEED